MDNEVLSLVAANSNKLIDTVTKVGVAYVGYKAVDHWSGALTGLVALKLATANNLAAGIAGVATLTGLGVMAGASARNPYLPDDNVPVGGYGTPYQIDVYQGVPDDLREYFPGRTG